MSEALWDDRDDKCTFDVMIEEFVLGSDALARLAVIVRGADTGEIELTPQSAGLLAASLGYSPCTATILSSSRLRCPSTMRSIAGAETR
jgi:hypothetical protein